MIRFHKTGKNIIQRAMRGAATGIICTPYYTERGLRMLDPFFEKAEKVEFWTRFSPLDWKAGVADMAALKQRVQRVTDRQKTFEVKVSDDLHAKMYSFSDNTVIIGSANLTWHAMTTNIEVICELTEDDAAVFLRFLPRLRSRLMPVGLDVFAAYVDVASDAISKPFDGPVEEDEEMNAAINLAEETLRKAVTNISPPASPIPPLEIEQFGDYCRQENTIISRGIVERIEGLHNLQGHVKHCYYGALRFFSQFPEFVGEIAATPGNSLYDFSNPPIREHWRDFLRSHANEIDPAREFSFRTLRLYLPPNLGGTRTGGGGGSGNLKRVLPVVARMLQGIGNTDGRH